MFRTLMMATRKQALLQNSIYKPTTALRVFSSQANITPSFGDLGDVMKANYTEEYN